MTTSARVVTDKKLGRFKLVVGGGRFSEERAHELEFTDLIALRDSVLSCILKHQEDLDLLADTWNELSDEQKRVLRAGIELQP